MLLKRSRINRRNKFGNLEIVYVTPIVMITSYPPRPERVSKMIPTVAKENFDNTCICLTRIESETETLFHLQNKQRESA